MKVFNVICSFLVMLVLSTVLNGYVLTNLWNWFVVDTFNAPSLALSEAIGVVLVVSFLTRDDAAHSENDKDISNAVIKASALAVTRPILALLMGWIITLFM